MLIDLSKNKKIKNSKHFFSEINQSYHPTGIFDSDKFNIVYSFETLNINKFVPILLKEWFSLVEKGGYLTIDYRENKFCSSIELEKNMEWLWRGKYKIIFHNKLDNQDLAVINQKKIEYFIKNPKKGEGDMYRFICKKIVSTKVSGDSINKWTFGIITNGKRQDWIGRIIKSIKDQKIPNYEIIICGTYLGKIEKNIKYIHFNKNDNKGWITKKKNLIVQKAKYENICMLHDRIVLGVDWFKGMRKWGNNFENLGCRQLFKKDRVNDWIVSHYFIALKDDKRFSFESHLDYRDWYKEVWFLGQLNIFKKSIIIKNNLWWNEKLYYGQKEDSDFSNKLDKKGYIHRLNSFSSVETLTNKYVKPTFVDYNENSSYPKMKIKNINAFLKVSTYIILRSLTMVGIRPSFAALENFRGRIYTLILILNPVNLAHNREWKRVSK